MTGQGRFNGKNGFVNVLEPVRLSDLADGTSHTAAQSEIVYTDNLSLRRLQNVWFVSSSMLLPAQWPVFLEACDAVPELSIHVATTVRGLTWFGLELYQHSRPPQHRACENGQSGNDAGVFPAASHHAAGAHVLMADGSVRFVSENIDGHVWESVGTRNSGDNVSPEF